MLLYKGWICIGSKRRTSIEMFYLVNSCNINYAMYYVSPRSPQVAQHVNIKNVTRWYPRTGWIIKTPSWHGILSISLGRFTDFCVSADNPQPMNNSQSSENIDRTKTSVNNFICRAVSIHATLWQIKLLLTHRCDILTLDFCVFLIQLWLKVGNAHCPGAPGVTSI